MLRKIFYSFGFIAILLTLLPLVAVDYWWIRVFDFPHTQLTILTFISILTFLIRFDRKSKKDYFFLTILIVCCGFQFYKIHTYTFVKPIELSDSSENVKTDLKLYSCNVFQKNEDKSLVITDIESLQPDVVLLTEVNSSWANALEHSFLHSYSFKEIVPLENTYGIALYSNLDLIDIETRFVVSDSIPSIHGKIKLKNGTLVQFHAIHPTPPVPQENDMSTNRDAEMMITAKMSNERKLPTIVFGDFNDVPWSETTELFKTVSRLLDPRIGRGLYNSYDANSVILKWPLDHMFISEEFRLKRFETRNDVNSDHYPMYAEFSFEPNLAENQKPKKPSKEDLERMENQIKEFKEKN
jgi:endonuclease/exonuclease/phosphatase (EEP) superfamily protein YafD